MAIAAGSGLEADLDPLVELRGGSGESRAVRRGAGWVILGVDDRLGELLAAAEKSGVEAFELGSVGGDRLSLSAAERDASVALADAVRAWRSLPERL